jgi:hypothetical protein
MTNDDVPTVVFTGAETEVMFLKTLIESFGIETSLDGPEVRGSGIRWGCSLYVRRADAAHANRIVADFRAKGQRTID